MNATNTAAWTIPAECDGHGPCRECVTSGSYDLRYRYCPKPKENPMSSEFNEAQIPATALYAGTSARPQMRPPGSVQAQADFPHIVPRLAGAIGDIEEMRLRLSQIADQLFGQVPEEVPGQERGPTTGFVEEMHIRVDVLEDRIQAMRRTISRFVRLVG